MSLKDNLRRIVEIDNQLAELTTANPITLSIKHDFIALKDERRMLVRVLQRAGKEHFS